MKQMGRNLSGQVFIGLFYAAKTSAISILLGLFGKIFLRNYVNGVLTRLYFNFQHITAVF